MEIKMLNVFIENFQFQVIWKIPCRNVMLVQLKFLIV